MPPLLPLTDSAFLHRDELRGVRLLLEYQKPELALREWNVRSTIVVFGSARMIDAQRAQQLQAAARTPTEKLLAEQKLRHARWYEDAREFARLVSIEGGALQTGPVRDNVIATGGGPGIMEAANRGAHDVGAPSIGFNIELPFEQSPNSYSTPDLTFGFQYFAVRKFHLALRANGLAIFPGGFGTLDELFEILTLLSCEKMGKVPVVLYDRSYWEEILNIPALLKYGMISEHDLTLFGYADTPQDAWTYMLQNGLNTRLSEMPPTTQTPLT